MRDEQDEEIGYLTVAMRENQEEAWNAACKMKDEEIEKLKLENRKAINAFRELSRYLADGENVDLCWVKDTVQLQAENECLLKAQHRMESRKLQKEIEKMKCCGNCQRRYDGACYEYDNLCEKWSMIK